MLKKSILASSLLLSTAASHAETNRSPTLTLTPDTSVPEGLFYDQVFSLIEDERTVAYGNPVTIEVNMQEETLDISIFDDFIVRVPLEAALVQPNRIEPTK